MRDPGSYITCLLLAAALLMPALFGVYLQGSRFLLKLKWQERLENERQVVLILANNEIHWYEKGKEIIINNQLFDIREMKAGKDSTRLTGIFDAEESSIQRFIDDYFNSREAEDDEGMHMGFLNLTFPESFPIRFNLAIPTSLPAMSGLQTASSPLSPTKPVPTPPPDRSC